MISGGRFYGMVLISAKCPRSPGRRENSVWTKIWGIIYRMNYSILFTGGIPPKLREREVLITPKEEECVFLWQMVQQNFRERLRIPRTHSETGIHGKERISAENLKAIGKSFNLKKPKMTKKSFMIFGLFKETSFIVIILTREFSCTCREKNHFLFHWNTLMSSGQPIPIGNRNLSDSWLDFTRFTLLNESPPNGYMWSGERLTKILTTSRPDHIWPDAWTKIGKAAQRREKQEWAIEKLERNLFHWSKWWRVHGHH